MTAIVGVISVWRYLLQGEENSMHTARNEQTDSISGKWTLLASLKRYPAHPLGLLVKILSTISRKIREESFTSGRVCCQFWMSSVMINYTYKHTLT